MINVQTHFYTLSLLQLLQFVSVQPSINTDDQDQMVQPYSVMY